MNKNTFLLLIFFQGFLSLAQDTKQNALSAFAKSYEYEASGKYESAIKSIESVYKKGFYEAGLRLGWLYYLKGDHVSSAKYYKAAITSEPKSVEARLGLAYPLSQMGNWNEIVVIYGEILKVDPKNYTANYRLALIWFNRKKFTQALPYVKTLRALHPFDYDCNLLLGKIYISTGKIVEARNILNSCLLYDPSSEEVKSLLKAL